jgi:hypothetical protein
MRSSVLSRSVIAVASLAIGSAVLVAAPATAATSTGITREMVLTAASSLRADAGAPTPAAQAALDSLSRLHCDIPAGAEVETAARPVDTPDGVDGLALTALIGTPDASEDQDSPGPFGSCSFTAIAPIGDRTTFSGEAAVDSIAVTVTSTGGFGDVSSTSTIFQLSGDVFASPAVQIQSGYALARMSATGLLTGPGSKRVLTTVKVADKKSKAVKRYAKKKYEKRIKAAKKAYAKALKRAGGNTAKKAEARMVYAARTSSVTSLYRYQVANYKLVKIRSSQADARRFSVTADSIFFGA